jgi:hypothetical protein
MQNDFVDVKIVGLEDDLTVQSHDNPALTYVYLRLSQTPPPLWKSHFKELRKISRHTHWRNAWIDRKYIVVECIPEEIELYHLNDLKQDIAKANQRCREYFKHQTRAEHQKHHAAEQVHERLREIKNRLNFD